MAAETAAVDWNWEDPDSLAGVMDEFMTDFTRCEKLEPVAAAPPFTRADLGAMGITGIEFAAFKTAHPHGLGTDLVGLRSDQGGVDGTTERGHIYRVDGSSYFTELDICEPLPIETGAVDWVYAEHLIEHVPLTAGIGWLAECRRILAPGGLLRVTTPDLRKYVEGYLTDDRFFAKHRRRVRYAIGIAPPMPERPAFMFNQIFYLYGHRWIYDLEELRYALTAAGFDDSTITVCAYREGARQDIADLDQTIRNDETLYVEVTA